MSIFSLTKIQDLTGSDVFFRRLAFIIMGLFYPLFHVTFVSYDTNPFLPIWGFALIFGLSFSLLALDYQLKRSGEQLERLIFGFTFLICTILVYLLYRNNFETAFFTMTGIYVVYALALLRDRYKLFWFLLLSEIGCLIALYFAESVQMPKPVLALWLVISGIILYLVLLSRLNLRQSADQKEKELHYQKEEFYNLFNSLSAMIVHKDLENTIIKVNMAHANFIGKPLDFFTGMSLQDILSYEEAKKYHDEDLEIAASELPKLGVLEEFTSLEGVKYWVRSDKRPVYDNNGKVTGIVIFSVNVSEQVEAEKQEKRSKELFRGIYEDAPYGILICDLSEQITGTNKTFQRFFGKKEKEWIGTQFYDIVIEEDKARIKGMINALKAKTISTHKDEITLLNINNKNIIANITLSLLSFENATDQLSIMIEDITDRKRSEDKLKRYSEDLIETNKDLEQFAYIASHDLKEPLRMISGYTSLLRRRYSSQFDDSAQEFMGYIMDGSHRITKMLDDLLHYSRASRDKNQKDMVEVSELVFTVMMNLRMNINERKVEIKVPAELPTVYCSKFQITLVLQNLIANAIKYCHADVLPMLDFNVVKKGTYWEFSIKDNGIGMEPEYLDKIFLIFKRLHRKGEFAGSGVGLAICKRIIQAHKGKIWATSAEGEGSTFYFSIPEFQPEDD